MFRYRVWQLLLSPNLHITSTPSHIPLLPLLLHLLFLFFICIIYFSNRFNQIFTSLFSFFCFAFLFFTSLCTWSHVAIHQIWHPSSSFSPSFFSYACGIFRFISSNAHILPLLFSVFTCAHVIPWPIVSSNAISFFLLLSSSSWGVFTHACNLMFQSFHGIIVMCLCFRVCQWDFVVVSVRPVSHF